MVPPYLSKPTQYLITGSEKQREYKPTENKEKKKKKDVF
jgi:hypothetical protein